MPRTTSQKKKLFALYQILYEHTDDNNGLTMTEILSKLQNRGILAERRSIYDDIEILKNDFDIDIEARKTTTTRYHLQSIAFKLPNLSPKRKPIPLSKSWKSCVANTKLNPFKGKCISPTALRV